MDEEMMKECYLALAQENKEFAAIATEIALEVIPEWE
jgi:hypothetical protein